MKRLIIKLTHKFWNKIISGILCNAYEDGLINSNQLHQLAAKFDPTQKNEVNLKN